MDFIFAARDLTNNNMKTKWTWLWNWTCTKDFKSEYYYTNWRVLEASNWGRLIENRSNVGMTHYSSNGIDNKNDNSKV